MKILFLDIDGVLNSLEWCQAGNGFGHPPRLRERCTKELLRWCPAMVKRLRRIVEETGAHIVVSSSWRGYGAHAVRKWRAMFAVYGWRNAPVIGETPDLALRSKGGIYVAHIRGDEVQAWIDEHPHVVEQFLCLDDDKDFHPHQPLKQTSMEYGLTHQDACECIRMLGSQVTATGNNE